MTAKGKITASALQIGDRIICKSGTYSEETASQWASIQAGDPYFHESRTKTGANVVIVRVTGKSFRAASGRYERQGRFVIETTGGTFEAAGCQTMWLAPEDPAGIKRAHVEALAEDADRAAEIERAAASAAEAAVADEAAVAYTEQIEASEANRHVSQTAGAENLTLHSQDGKVDTNSKDDEPEEPEMTAETQTANATENHTGSAVVATLEKVWARIREDHPELPEVVIITGSGLVGGSKWGHFRAEGWKVREEGAAVRKHELFLAGEALAKGARQVLQTMLHEGAHTLARVRQLQDTSRQGRWHNATFRKLAEEMGLEHKGSSADKSHGFSFVTLTTATVEKYADLLAELDREIRLVCHLPLWMGGTAEEEDDKGGEKIGKAPKGEGEDETKPKSGPLKATCACEEPVIIRVSQKVLDLGVVKCTECEELFRAA